MVSYVAPRAQLSQQTSISYDVYMERKGVSNEMLLAEGDLYLAFRSFKLNENFSLLFTNVSRKVLFVKITIYLNSVFFCKQFKKK